MFEAEEWESTADAVDLIQTPVLESDTLLTLPPAQLEESIREA